MSTRRSHEVTKYLAPTGQAFIPAVPVLLLIVARVLWTARPPARPVLGAEATMAAPAGPITFKCPLAVRSTCPPARCTAATISLASLDRQRFGVAFSSAPPETSAPQDPSRTYRGQRTLCSQAPDHPAAPRSETRRTADTTGGSWPRSALGRATAVPHGRQRSPAVATVQTNRRSSPSSSSRSRDDAGGRFRLWSRRSSQQRASTLRVMTLPAHAEHGRRDGRVAASSRSWSWLRG